MIPFGIFLGIPIYAFTGQYLAITRFTGRKTIYRILFRNLLFLLLLILFGHYFLKFNVPEVKVNILIWIVLNTLMGFSVFL